jgi:excisionase family DNA binding protein
MRVLGVDELAKIFDCSRESIKRKARAGELPAFKLGKFWYVREEDLEQHLSSTVHLNGHLRRVQENHR